VSANGQDYSSDGKVFSFFDRVVVHGVSPSYARARGETLVRVIGMFFASPSRPECHFGRQSVPAVMTSLSVITCQTPAVESVESVTMPFSVSISGLASDESAQSFLFAGDLQLASVVPSTGGVAIASKVTVTGSGFVEAATGCKFGVSQTRAGSVVSSTLMVCTTPPMMTAGTVELSASDVMSFDGHTSLGNALYFEVVAPPSLLDVTPSRSDALGGNLILMTGRGFVSSSGLVCRFGKTTAAVLRFTTSSRVACLAPAFALGGNFSASVSNDGSTFSNELTFEVAELSVSGVKPSMGPRAGGTSITVRGQGFASLAVPACLFGAHSVLATRASDSKITCLLPSSELAAFSTLNVSASDAASLRSRSRSSAPFQYFQDLTILHWAPTRGPLSGGTRVQVHFSGGAHGLTPHCIFAGNSVPASAVTSGVVTCTSPPHTESGRFAVGIAWGSPVASGTVSYIYDADAQLTGLTPSSGPASGGTVVRIAVVGAVDTATFPLCRFGSVEVQSLPVLQVLPVLQILPVLQLCSSTLNTLPSGAPLNLTP